MNHFFAEIARALLVDLRMSEIVRNAVSSGDISAAVRESLAAEQLVRTGLGLHAGVVEEVIKGMGHRDRVSVRSPMV